MGAGPPEQPAHPVHGAHTAAKQTNAALSEPHFPSTVNSPLQACGLRGPSQNDPTACPWEPRPPSELSCELQSRVVREAGVGSQTALHGAPGDLFLVLWGMSACRAVC